MRASTEVLRRVPWRDAAGAVGAGLALGAAVALVRAAGVTAAPTRALIDAAAWLQGAIGPVWIPMAAVAARVAWLAGRALASRSGRVASGPVRPELARLAPLFAALGLCGTVWGLGRAFDALESGEFLGQLPALLGGLGAAMTSTLAGLGLQIATLLLAGINPAWSTARVCGAGDEAWVELDGRRLDRGVAGVEALVDALGARRPEALRLELDRRLAPALREQVRARLWAQLDAELPVREVGT